MKLKTLSFYSKLPTSVLVLNTISPFYLKLEANKWYLNTILKLVTNYDQVNLKH